MTVLKYCLKLEAGYEEVEIADNSLILAPKEQLGDLVFYTLTDQDPQTKMIMTKVTFLKLETGKTFDIASGKHYNYLGTVSFREGLYILHVILVIPKKQWENKR